MELADIFHQPNFHNLIRQFLFDQAHLLDPDAPLGMDVPLAQCPAFDSFISVYHTMTAIFYSPSNSSGLWGMCQECIQANPYWCKHLPQHDTVFIECDPTLPRI
jgi:hypothetical protein